MMTKNACLQPRASSVSGYYKPSFMALSTSDLLGRCVLGATQNQNESLNPLVWVSWCRLGQVPFGLGAQNINTMDTRLFAVLWLLLFVIFTRELEAE